MARRITDATWRQVQSAVEDAVDALKALGLGNDRTSRLQRQARKRLRKARKQMMAASRVAGSRARAAAARTGRPSRGRGVAFAAGATSGVLGGIVIGRSWARGTRGTELSGVAAEDAKAVAKAVKERAEAAAAHDSPRALEVGREVAERAANTAERSPSSMWATIAGSRPGHDGGEHAKDTPESGDD
jgi:ElaB/YqjD/DUF883 family membrane-anchored ribosome-binding protein